MKSKCSIIFLPPACWPIFDHAFEIILSRLNTEKDSEVFIISVDNSLRFNPSFSKINFIGYLESQFKTFCLKRILKDKNYKFLELKKIRKKRKNISANIRKLGLDCAINSIQAHFKDTTINQKSFFSFFIKNALNDYLDGFDSLKIIRKRFDVNDVYIFNGRMSIYRGVMQYCIDNKLNYYCYEYPFQGKKRFLLTHKNPLHDLSFKSKRFKYQADNHPLSIIKKANIGDNWFRRRNKERMGFELNFSNYQNNKNIPQEILERQNKGQKILLLLNGSEWEVSGFKETQTDIFGSQYNAISWLIKFLRNTNEFFLVFRFHPQFSFRDNQYKNKLNKLLSDENSNNIFIVQPESKINTQELIKNADLIFTFYSSTAPEAAYYGKRVIAIGPSSFQEFKCCEIPTSKNNLYDLLKKNNELTKNELKLRKEEAKLWSFGRAFQGYKPYYLKYDKLLNPFIFINKKKVYLYSPLFILYLLRIIGALFLSMRKINKVNISKINNILKINSFNF